MKKQLIASSLLGIALTFSMPIAAFAQTPSEDKVMIRNCEQKKDFLTRKINHWQEKKEVNVKHWQKARERIQNIIAKLREKGYDVTKLEEDMKEAEKLRDEMHIAYDNVIAKALEARSNACADKDVFKANIKELKDLIKTAQDKWQEFKSFMKNDFIPDLKSYKNITLTPTQTLSP